MTNFKDSYRKDLQFILSLIQGRDFIKAKVLIDKLIDKNPNNKQLQMVYGDCLVGMGRLKLARSCFYECLSELELRATCYGKIAWISEKLEEFSQALIYYKKALQINPNNSESANSMGNVHRKNNSYSEAIRYYNKAIQVEPKNIIARTNKGLVKHIQGDYSGSIEIFKQVLIVDKNNFPATKALANGYMKIGKFQDAFSYFEKAQALAPTDLSITIQLAEASKRLRKYKNWQ